VPDLPFELASPWDTALYIGLAFAVAWAVSRWARRVAETLVRRYEARAIDEDDTDTSVITGMKRRDTAVSLTTTTLRYVVFGAALIFAGIQLAGATRAAAVASASLLVVLIGFAGQRFLTDILAGFFMFFEGWYAVGDTVRIEPWGVEGVVEEVSLRATKLRAVNGDTLRVHNSQILVARVLPRGVRELDIELFVSDADAGRALVEEVGRLMPTGPLHFIRRPWVAEAEQLDADMVRIKARATIAPGREWLARDFLVELMKERAGEDLLLHGPVVIDVDEVAVRRYARSFTRTGRRERRAS
jgi:small conductance mechanosensitive channel